MAIPFVCEIALQVPQYQDSKTPSTLNAFERTEWFIKNAKQRNFDVILDALNAKESYEDGFSLFDLSSSSDVKRIAHYFYEAKPALLSKLRSLGWVEGYGVTLKPEPGDNERVPANLRQVHDPEINRTCALAVFKLRRLFFANEPVKERYRADELIPIEKAQVHPEYLKTKKKLDQFFLNKTVLYKRLMGHFKKNRQNKNINNDVYFQLASRFLYSGADAVTSDIFESEILKDEKQIEKFIWFAVNGLYDYYHVRLGKTLKNDFEPKESGEIAPGIVLKDKKSIDGEIPYFCGTPEESLVLAWKILHAEGECAPNAIQTEKTADAQKEVRENLISDYLFHLAGVFYEYQSGLSSCGQGSWVRTLDFFNKKYDKKVLEIASDKMDTSRINKQCLRANYSDYIAKALRDKHFWPYLGALYFWTKGPWQQAFIGAVKQAFLELCPHHFDELPKDYVLTKEDWEKFDSFLSDPIFATTLQSEILKIANPFLAEKKEVIFSNLQLHPEQYQPAFQKLALLIQEQELNLLKQISVELTNILQYMKDNKRVSTYLCKELLKVLGNPLACCILPPELYQKLKVYLEEGRTLLCPTPDFLVKMDSVDLTVDRYYQEQNKKSLTVEDSLKPAPHALFELMGDENAAHVFWKNFVADKEIQKALLARFPEVPLKGMTNPYTQERLKRYVFESKISQQKLDLTTKGLLPKCGVLEKSRWDNKLFLERASDTEHLGWGWLKALLKRYQNEIQQDQSVELNHLLGRLLHDACQHNQAEIVQLLLQHENINVMWKDWRKNTPLHWACRYGYTEIINLLLATKKVDVNRPNGEGCTPLEYARIANNSGIIDDDMIALLLEYRKMPVPVESKRKKRASARRGRTRTESDVGPESPIQSQDDLKHGNAMTEKEEHLKCESQLSESKVTLSGFEMRDIIWGDLKSIYEKQQDTGLKGWYWRHQRTVKQVLACTGVGLLLLLPLLFIRCIQTKSLKLGWHLMWGPKHIEKITLPEGKTFSDYQTWRRRVPRTLSRWKRQHLDYEKVDRTHYRKKQDYVKKETVKHDPFDDKEQDGENIYLPTYKAGMVFLYTQQPDADEVNSAAFRATKGRSSAFVRKLKLI